MPSLLALLALTAATAPSIINAQATSGTVIRPSSASTTRAAASAAFTPHVAKEFTYPDGIPPVVDTVGGIRGPQYGYNRCNATTEGQNSRCQTAFINAIDDFCLWGAPEPNSVVGNIEGEMVAYCTRPGRGTRLIPPGALKGVQFLRAPTYIQVTGFIDQRMINIRGGDYGGEMDPHGADQRGNPIGGLLYSQAFGGNTTAGQNSTRPWTQVMQWHNFMGSDMFCLKACNPSDPNDYRMCEHIYDRIGCWYNAPAAYRNGTFESCLSDNQLFPGVYVDGGVTRTYTQPPESLGVISTMPYTAAIPSSSQCTTYTSAQLYAGLGSAPSPSSSSPVSSTAGTLPTGSASRGVGANAAAQPTQSTPNAAAGNHALSAGSALLAIAVGLVALF